MRAKSHRSVRTRQRLSPDSTQYKAQSGRADVLVIWGYNRGVRQ